MIQAPSSKAILYIDADPVCHVGLATLLENDPNFSLTHSVTRYADSLLVDRTDLIMLEIGSAKSHGIAVIRELKSKHPQTPVLVLTSYNESLYAERCLKAGASGYIMKTAALGEIRAAMDCVADGQLYVSENVKSLMVDRLASPQSEVHRSGFNCLSDRELLIVEQIGLSKNNKEIAQTLQISIKTIESHRSRIKAKLRLDSPQELMRYAMRMHLI